MLGLYEAMSCQTLSDTIWEYVEKGNWIATTTTTMKLASKMFLHGRVAGQEIEIIGVLLSFVPVG